MDTKNDNFKKYKTFNSLKNSNNTKYNTFKYSKKTYSGKFIKQNQAGMKFSDNHLPFFNSKTMPLPITIYNVLKFSKYRNYTTKRDIRRISNAVNSKYELLFGKEKKLERILQVENDNNKDNVYIVYSYNKDFYKEIVNIVKWYFHKKKLRQDNNTELLQQAKLEQLKKTDIEQYNIELAKIKELEKIKKANRNNYSYKNKKYNDKAVTYSKEENNKYHNQKY